MGLPVDFGGDDLYVNNVYTGNTAPGQLVQGGSENISQTISSATATLTSSQSGGTFVLSRAAGVTVTLPTPAAGLTYTFIVGTVATSNAHKIITGTPASQFLLGGVYFDKALTITRYDGNGSSHVSLNLNGTTTGGATIGDTVQFIGVSATEWSVSGTVTASGTLATPFATS